MSLKSFLSKFFIISSNVKYNLNIYYASKRLYRIKTPSFLTKEDRWMLHVYKVVQPQASTITDELMKIMKEKVEILEKCGCHRYQIVEVPQILLVTDEDIAHRCAFVKRHAGPANVSAPIVCLLADSDVSPRELLDKIDQYKQKKSGGFVSIADYWLNKFECNKMELLELVGKNPRLFSTSTKNMEIKMNILLKYGARLEDIRAHSHILKNRRAGTLEQRARDLHASRPGEPLCISWLAQSDSIYREILHNHLRSEESKGERIEYFTNTFGGQDQLTAAAATFTHHHTPPGQADNGLQPVDCPSSSSSSSPPTSQQQPHPSSRSSSTSATPVGQVCRDATFWLKIPYVSEQQFHILKPKLEFLLSKGYTHDDIATAPYIFKLGLASLRSIHDELHQRLAIEHVTLRMICSFSQRRAISKYRLPQHVLAKVIGCSPEDISPLSKELRVMFLQSVSVMTMNFRFLVDECRFSPADVQRLPVILGHAHNQVRSHWQSLPERPELQPFSDWSSGDSSRLLNVLQYYIERQHNYQHPIVFDGVANSDTTTQHQRSLEGVQSLGVDLPGDRREYYAEVGDNNHDDDDEEFDFEITKDNSKHSTSMDYRYLEITNSMNASKKISEINA